MTFRTRLFLAFVLTTVAVIAAVSWAVGATTRNAFERFDAQRADDLVAQFRREFTWRGQEVQRKMDEIAASEAALRIAVDLSRAGADASAYVQEAREMASRHGLDLLELVAHDGAIISSAHWPARFGFKNDWITQAEDWKAQGPFLQRIEIPEENALGLIVVRAIIAGNRELYIAGGVRLNQNFLGSLSLPAGMRASLVESLSPASGPTGPLIEEVTRTKQEASHAAGAETLHAIPLAGRNQDLLGVLLLASSRQALLDLASFIRWAGLLAAAAGVVLGAILIWWVTARVTRPVRLLAEGARQVAGGNWDARVEVATTGEVGELAGAFNHMTRQLAEQRERLVQTERVAAWRELARRLAHELKNPLFPLQITVENLQRARHEQPAQFDEVFDESTRTLLAELGSLRTIIGRFSDFARMPPPALQPVDVNEVVRGAHKVFDAQLHDRIRCQLNLAGNLPAIQADPEQLGRALRNLILNAMDAMPDGGALDIRTLRLPEGVRVEVADSGTGLTPEECERLFTPYYTTKQHGTGLGLAIVQSVVSDHHGRIAVASEPGHGTTVRIDLPETPPCPTS